MRRLTKRQLWAGLVTAFCVVITIILMVSCYKAGREKGREEAVTLINDKAAEYTFYIKDEDGWQLGSGGGGQFFPDYKGVLMSSYDWDDCKIHLWYDGK